MKKFTQWELKEALAHTAAGGQALHLHRIIVDRRKAPKCFVRDVDAGKDIAHLFDQDEKRLRLTAKQLGVRVLVVEHMGTDGQHIDLCGAPLRKAITLCSQSPLLQRQEKT